MYYVIYGLQFNKKQLPLIAHTIITIISLFANSFLYFVYLSRYFLHAANTVLIALHQCQRLLTFPIALYFITIILEDIDKSQIHVSGNQHTLIF